MCATTLALLHRGRVVLAVIDAPFLAQRYRAIEGKDAFTGTTALTVSNTASFHDAVVALGDHAVGDHADRKNGHSRRRPTLTAARRSGGRQSGRPPGQRTSHRQEDHSPHRERYPSLDAAQRHQPGNPQGGTKLAAGHAVHADGKDDAPQARLVGVRDEQVGNPPAGNRRWRGRSPQLARVNFTRAGIRRRVRPPSAPAHMSSANTPPPAESPSRSLRIRQSRTTTPTRPTGCAKPRSPAAP